MTKKEKQLEKQKKIKTIIKWVLCGLGWSALAFCFISLLCIGVKGCSNNSKQNETEVNVRPVLQKNEAVLNASNVITIKEGTYYIVNQHPDYYSQNYSRENYSYNYDCTGYYNGDYFNKVNTNNVANSSTRNTLILRLYNDNTILASVNWVAVDTGEGYIVSNDFTSGYELEVEAYNGGNIDIIAYEFFGTIAQSIDNFYNFTFNDVINPFAPIGLNNDYFQTGNYTGNYVIANGLFKTIDDDIFYNQIQIGYYDASASRFGTETSYNIAPSGTYQYMYLAYRRVSDDAQVIVNSVKYVKATEGSAVGNSVLTNSNYWVSNSFKRIQVYNLENAGNLPALSLTGKQLLNAFNNLTSYNGATSIATDIGGNPLTLLGSAFGGLTGLFGISIIPGITLGVLLFLPLVAGIVLAIVKVVRK